MSVVVEVTPITLEGTVYKEHLSRLKICYEYIAYTTSESTFAPSSFGNLAYFNNRTVSQCFFLLTAFALESKCKITNKNRTGKIYFCQFPRK